MCDKSGRVGSWQCRFKQLVAEASWLLEWVEVLPWHRRCPKAHSSRHPQAHKVGKATESYSVRLATFDASLCFLCQPPHSEPRRRCTLEPLTATWTLASGRKIWGPTAHA
jgi:hypothetical protein